MTVPTIAAPTPARPDRTHRRPARLVPLVLGTLLLLVGLPLLATGGLLLWTSGVHRSDGFVTSPEDRFTTQRAALVSDRIDLQAGAGWLPVHAALGDARLEVTPRSDDALFVGVARASDVRAYLHGVGRTEIEALGFGSSVRAVGPWPGSTPPGPPADQGFWIARATGTGTQRVTWPAAEGNWMFVIMKADGSPGIDVHGRIGAQFPALGTVAWTVLVVGLGVTVVGVLLIAPSLRRRR